MSTILQQSCIESQFIENAKLLKLKVAASAPPKSMEFARTSSIENRGDLKIKNFTSNTTDQHGVGTGWSFLQSMPSSKETVMMMEKENSIYIHPLMYKNVSSPRLSEKSLQLCTENLGCETGSFFIDTNILSLTSSYNNYYSMEEENPAAKKQSETSDASLYSSSSIKKVKYSSNRELPPPLTTMSGEKSLQVKTHREDGRLIIQATEKPLKESCFIAQRSEGCLKLCFLKDVFTDMQQQQEMSSPEGNEAEEEEADIKNENDMMMMMNKDIDDPGENEEEMSKKEYAVVVGNSNTNNNSNNVNDKEVEIMGKEKAFQRLGGRCKECKKNMCNWEPLWVATS